MTITTTTEIESAIQALRTKHLYNQGDTEYWDSMRFLVNSLMDGTVTQVADVSHYDLLVAVGFVLDEMFGEITR